MRSVSMTSDVPARARVVIVGGGIVGTSVAYHLTKLGVSNVALLEQGQLSCGTTGHAAGLVGQVDIAGERFAATAHVKAPYDPTSERKRL